MNKKSNEILYYKNNIVDTLNRMMYSKEWTIKQLSEKAELPYESVKKLIGGKINNPTIYTLIKLSKALDCGLDFLLEPKETSDLHPSKLSKRTFTLLVELANFEMHLANYNNLHKTQCITTLVPTGNIYDGMIFDSFYTDSVDISAYQQEFGDIIMCGVKIIGKNLQPTYLNNDILLIAKDRYPVDNENGIFIVGQRAYIRKYISEYPMELAPVNNVGNSLIITDINDVHFFGRILTVIRK